MGERDRLDEEKKPALVNFTDQTSSTADSSEEASAKRFNAVSSSCDNKTPPPRAPTGLTTRIARQDSTTTGDAKNGLTKDEKLQLLCNRVVFKSILHSGAGVAEDLSNYVDEHDVHMVCMGHDAKRLRAKKSYMGSVSGKVLSDSDVPVVIAHYDERAFQSSLTDFDRELAKGF